MADPEFGNQVKWYAPDPRAVLPLDGLRVSRSLRRTIKSGEFETSSDRCFSEVVWRCADRESTWISPEIARVYKELFELGFAHSVEVWYDGELAGGLYGVALGGAFFGESMFHDLPNASKVALVGLVEHLRTCGFEMLDIQFMTPHLQQFGAVEIRRSDYLLRLASALDRSSRWRQCAGAFSLNDNDSSMMQESK